MLSFIFFLFFVFILFDLLFFASPGPGVRLEEENGPRAGSLQQRQTHSDLLQFPEAAAGGPHVPDGRAAEGRGGFAV